MEQLSNKPRSFFTPKKLYLLQKQQEEKANQEATTSNTMVGRRGEKKLPEALTDAHPASEMPTIDEREPEVFHSPTKRSRGKTGKHLRLLAALDKEKSKDEHPPEAEQMDNEPVERVSEPGYSGHGETGKRPGGVAHPKELQVKKQCEKKLYPGKDINALMGTSSGTGRGRGRGRGRPPKSSYEHGSRYQTTANNMVDTAPPVPVFNVRHQEETGGPTQRPCLSMDTIHEGSLSDGAARGRLDLATLPQSASHSHPSGMCDEITSSGDPVRAFPGPAPTAGQWDQHQAKDDQSNDIIDKSTNLIKVEPDSQRVGSVERNTGEQQSCMVCGDVAAGFHCGAYVCEACKKFFVRCLKQDVGNKFMCSKNKMCVVNRETRTQCQYCRYQKCISLGMYKPGSGPGGGKFGAEISHIPCKVCESPSSGYHFGAITCEGCKGFFRRTVKERSGVRYVCSRSGACNITVNTRNVCKYCRYQKCLQAGMTPDGSRIGRQPNAVKHATMLELQRLGSGSTSTDTNLVEVKQEQASPPSENQDSGFPDNAQFEMIDPSNLPEELYLTQSEEEGKLRAIKSQPFSPSEVLDLPSPQPEPDDLKLYKPAYSHQHDAAMREQSQFPGHKQPTQFASQYLEPRENPHAITVLPHEQVIPQPRSFRESQQSGKGMQHQQMQGYANKDEIYQQEQAQREQAQRQQVQTEQAQREKSQREQMEREQAQRLQMQREMAQREQMQREQAQREQLQREQTQREKMQREQMQREQAQREQMQRERVQREQQATLGQSLQRSLSVHLDPRLLQPKADDVSSAEYQEHLQRLARIEALNAEQQELKRQEQQKAMELKMEIRKLASHSKYMMEISHLKGSGDQRAFVEEKPLHGKPLSAAVAMDMDALQRKEVASRAPSFDATTSNYTSPDSAHFSLSPENEWLALDNKSMNDVFEPNWCGESRSPVEVLVGRGKDLQATLVPGPSPPMSRPSVSSGSSPVVSQTETSCQMPTDLSSKRLSRSNSGMSTTKASPKDCIEIMNRVPSTQRNLIEVIRKASLLLRPILEKNPDCKQVNLEATAEEMWDTMMSQFNQCAKSVIQFARKVPGFLQFPVAAQIIKVQMAMYPIVLTVLSTQYNMETKIFNYFHMTQKEREVVFTIFPGYSILCDHFHAMGHSVKYVEMDDIEIAFFCAVILMSADMPGQEPQDPLVNSEDLITALRLYCVEKEGKTTNRDGYILARLAEVNRCNAEHQKAVLNVMMMHPTLKVPQLYEETYLAM